MDSKLVNEIIDCLEIDTYTEERNGKYTVSKFITVICSNGLWYGKSFTMGSYENNTTYYSRDQAFTSNLGDRSCGFSTAEEAATDLANRFGIVRLKKVLKKERCQGYYMSYKPIFKDGN